MNRSRKTTVLLFWAAWLWGCGAGRPSPAATRDVRYAVFDSESVRSDGALPLDVSEESLASLPMAPAMKRSDARAVKQTAAEGTPQDVSAEPASVRLIYTAHLQLAVYEVDKKQREAIEVAEKLGGFLSEQAGERLVLRVPAAQFKAAMAQLETVGDVLHRELKASDVGEEYRDLEIRIDSARRIRERLLALLEKAASVQESLAIEAQIERLTKEIEQLEGRLRFLKDRIALSTITLTFRPLAEEQLGANELELPFPWLDELGLRHLMELR